MPEETTTNYLLSTLFPVFLCMYSDYRDYDEGEDGYYDQDLGNDCTEYDDEPDPPEDQFMSDVEADADTLASAGYGTDEDYGYFGPVGYNED